MTFRDVLAPTGAVLVQHDRLRALLKFPRLAGAGILVDLADFGVESECWQEIHDPASGAPLARYRAVDGVLEIEQGGTLYWVDLITGGRVVPVAGMTRQARVGWLILKPAPAETL